VLDSSVLVPSWSRIRLQELASEPEAKFAPCWSEWIIAETWRILTQQWFRRHGPVHAVDVGRLRYAANEMMRYLLPVMRLVTLRGYSGPDPWPGLTDQDARPIWQTAVAAGTRYVISQNTRHFPPLEGGRHVYKGIEYLTAIEFIEDVLGADPAPGGRSLPPGASLRSLRRR
jgi:hypothetical protein